MRDPDPAGRHVAERLTDLLADHDIHPTVITPPAGCDVNAWALTDPGWAHTLDDHLGARPAVSVDHGLEL